MRIAHHLRTLLLAAVVLAVPAASFAGIFISIGIAPPPLPVYVQPAIPGDGYMWTPGYWAWSDDGGYYWVPGTWVQPPQVGVLWTPGYWGWSSGAYVFNAGYWGPHIGFYGGVNYGFGYGGGGYEGGYWNNGRFNYNTSVNNVSNVHITNVYNKTVINNTTVNNTSYNGGTGGVQARPTASEQAALHENHIPPTSMQMQHVTQAQNNPQLRASVNGGKPAIAATSRPGDFKSAVPARQAGGQVNTAVYKAAADNKGKLPSNVKDPGEESHAANTAARPNMPNKNGANTDRPVNSGTANNRNAANNHPENTAAKPNTAARPENGSTHSENNAQPKAQSQPQNHSQQRPASETQSHPQQQQHPQQEHPQQQSHPQQHPQQSHPQEQSHPEEKPKR